MGLLLAAGIAGYNLGGSCQIRKETDASECPSILLCPEALMGTGGKGHSVPRQEAQPPPTDAHRQIKSLTGNCQGLQEQKITPPRWGELPSSPTGSGVFVSCSLFRALERSTVC